MTMPRGTDWSRAFGESITLPNGKTLVTLRDAASYFTELPKAEHEAFEWQAAMEALILVAEHDGPTMFARIGVMRALNRHMERVFSPDRKDTHWGKRKLKRDE
jgi:hypothetical protein